MKRVHCHRSRCKSVAGVSNTRLLLLIKCLDILYITLNNEHLSERASACISMPQTHYFKLFSFWLKTLGPWAWRANHTFYLDRHLMKLHYRGCKIPKYHRLSGWVEWVAQLFNQIKSRPKSIFSTISFHIKILCLEGTRSKWFVTIWVPARFVFATLSCLCRHNQNQN